MSHIFELPTILVDGVQIPVCFSYKSVCRFPKSQGGRIRGKKWEHGHFVTLKNCCCYSVTKSFPTLCDSMDYHAPGFPVLHYLLKFVQIHFHWVDEAIQPSLPLLPFSPFAFNLSQHQGLFQWVGSSQQVAKLLKLQLQYPSLQWIFRIDFLLGLTVCSPCSPRDSQESSPTPKLKSINSSVLSFLYGPTLTSTHDYQKNHSFD